MIKFKEIKLELARYLKLNLNYLQPISMTHNSWVDFFKKIINYLLFFNSKIMPYNYCNIFFLMDNVVPM
jgi:hypothetical protein